MPGGMVWVGRPDPVVAVGVFGTDSVEGGGSGTREVFVGAGGVVATGGWVGGMVGGKGVSVDGRLQADRASTTAMAVKKSLRFILLLPKNDNDDLFVQQYPAILDIDCINL